MAQKCEWWGYPNDAAPRRTGGAWLCEEHRDKAQAPVVKRVPTDDDLREEARRREVRAAAGIVAPGEEVAWSCITLMPPWSYAMAWGFKEIETRSAGVASQFRGLVGGSLYVHTSAKVDPDVFASVNGSPASRALWGPVFEAMGVPVDRKEEWPVGAILSEHFLEEVFSFADRRRVDALSEQERAMGGYHESRYGLYMPLSRRLVAPMPARGMLGRWTYRGVGV